MIAATIETHQISSMLGIWVKSSWTAREIVVQSTEVDMHNDVDLDSAKFD